MAKPKVLTSDIYKHIAKQSSLTQAQVKECFDTYYNIVMALMASDNRPEDLTIAIPKIGTISFKQVEGVKKGFRYYHNGEFLEVQEDKVDYERMKITISSAIQEKIRQISENKTIRKQSFNLDFLKGDDNDE